MIRRVWPEKEFAMVVNGYGKSIEELLKELPGRTADAIEVVIEGIHDYHKKGRFKALSKMMIDYLERFKGKLMCPKCGTVI